MLLLFLQFAGPVTRTTDTNEAFFYRNNKLFGLGRQFGQINVGAFVVLSVNLSATVVHTVSPLSMFPINHPLILQKAKPLYPNPKYLFGIGI